MPRLLLVIAALFSFSSVYAADEYVCQIEVRQNGGVLDVVSFSKSTGMMAGRLYTLPLSHSEKKSLFGKTEKTVEIAISGFVQCDGPHESSIDAEVSLVTTTEHQSLFRRDSSESKVDLGKIEGKGTVRIDQMATDGYELQGSCEFQSRN